MKPTFLWSPTDMDLFLGELDADLTKRLATRASALLSVPDAIDAATEGMNAEQLQEAVALIVGYLAELDTDPGPQGSPIHPVDRYGSDLTEEDAA